MSKKTSSTTRKPARKRNTTPDTMPAESPLEQQMRATVEQARKARAQVLIHAYRVALEVYAEHIEADVERALGMLADVQRWIDGGPLSERVQEFRERSLAVQVGAGKAVGLDSSSDELDPELVRAMEPYESSIPLVQSAIHEVLTVATDRKTEGLRDALNNLMSAIEQSTQMGEEDGPLEQAVTNAVDRVLGWNVDRWHDALRARAQA